MIVSGANIEDILEEKIDGVAAKQNFDSINAKKIKTDNLEAKDATITALITDYTNTDALTVNWDPVTDESTVRVEQDEINLGSGKPVVVNVQGTLNYNGHQLEALIAGGGAGQPIDITHINNQSVTTNVLRSNGAILGRELEIYKHQNQTYPFQVVIGNTINDSSEVRIGQVSTTQGIADSKANLLINGNATINETLTVRGNIVDAQNRTIQQQVEGFTDNYLQRRVDFGNITVTGLKKQDGQDLDLGKIESIKVTPIRGASTTLTNWISTTIDGYVGTLNQMGRDGWDFTILGNLKVPDSLSCKKLTISDQGNGGQVDLGLASNITVKYNLNGARRETNLKEFIMKVCVPKVSNFGEVGKNVTFNGGVICKGGLQVNGKISAYGEIDTKNTAITCGSLRAATKINVGVGEQCYMDSNGGKMVCNNFEKLNYQTNATGKIKLGLPEHIIIRDGNKDVDLKKFIQNNAPVAKSVNCTKATNFGTAQKNNINIGNDNVENCYILAKKVDFPPTNSIMFKDTDKSLKELIDDASKSGGGGSGITDCEKIRKFGTSLDPKETILIGHSAHEKAAVYSQKFYIPTPENLYVLNKDTSLSETTYASILDDKIKKCTGGPSCNAAKIFGRDAGENAELVFGQYTTSNQRAYYSGNYIELGNYANNIMIGTDMKEGSKIVIGNPLSKQQNDIYGNTLKTHINNEINLACPKFTMGDSAGDVKVFARNLTLGDQRTKVLIHNKEYANEGEENEDEESYETFTLGELVNAVKGKYTKEDENGGPLETQILPGWITTDNATVNDQFSAKDATITGDLIVDSITTEGDYITVKCPTKINGDVELDGSLKAHSLSATHIIKAAQGDFESITVNSIDCDQEELPMKKIKLTNPLQDAVINRDNATGSYTHKLGAELADPGKWLVNGIGFFNIAFHRLTEFVVMVTGPIHVDFDSDSLERINSKKFSCSNFFAEATETIFPAPLIKECLHDLTIPFTIKVSYTNNVRTYPAKLKITLTEISIEYDESTKPDDFFEDWSETNLITNVELIPGDAFIRAPSAQTLAAYNNFYNPNKAPILEKYT